MLLFNYSNLVDPLLREIREFVLSFTGMTTEDKVLDICCGTGEQVITYGLNGIDAIGIDNDSGMLKVALKNTIKRQLTNVSFNLANATDLPFPDGHFDYSSISCGLHVQEKKIRDRVIHEMKRVVKRGGKFIFIDFRVPLPINMWGFVARIAEFIIGGDHYRGFKSYITGGGLSAILKEHNIRELYKTQLTSGLIEIIKAAND